MTDDTLSSDSLSASSPISAGALLRNARMAKGLTLDELASETRIARAILEAMESDRDPAGQAPVFMRGFYRRCAKAVGLEEQTLLAAYELRVGSPQPARIQTQLRQPQPDSKVTMPSLNSMSSSGWGIAAAVSVLLCIILLTVLLSDDKEEAQENADSAAVVSPLVTSRTPEPASPAPMASSTPAFTSPLQPTLPEAAPSAAQTAVAGAAVIPPPSTASNTSESAPEGLAVVSPTPAVNLNVPNQLVVEYTQSCWTSITDDDGKRLLQGIFNAGDRKEVAGKPPYRVVLGYGPGAKLFYEGKPVDFTKQMEDGKLTARVTIPEED